MKHLIFLMLILGSTMAFASTGEDQTTVNEGMKCQSELNKSTILKVVRGDDSTEALEG